MNETVVNDDLLVPGHEEGRGDWHGLDGDYACVSPVSATDRRYPPQDTTHIRWKRARCVSQPGNSSRDILASERDPSWVPVGRLWRRPIWLTWAMRAKVGRLDFVVCKDERDGSPRTDEPGDYQT
jgi:hypothetical protein